MKVTKQNAAKLGLMAAIMVIFGNVVGIGIFFKNKGVFAKNDSNPYGVLFAWIASAILVLFIALSFVEICSGKSKNKTTGLGGWAENFCGHQLGRWTKIGYPIVYFMIQTFTCVFFAGEAIINIVSSCQGSSGSLDFGNLTTLYIMIAGLGLLAVFTILNWKASKVCSQLGQKLSLFKFLPILLVIILGIAFGIASTQCGLWTGHQWGESQIQNKPINIMGIIMSVPGILFAFEGYLVIGSISGEIDNAEKNVPLSMVFAILLISAVNIAITVGCITCGTGNVFELMEIVFNNVGNKDLWIKVSSTVFSCFIFVCIIGVVNGMSFGGIRALQSACEENLLFKSQKIRNMKPNDPLFAGFTYYVFFMLLLILGCGIPSIILNTDNIIDGLSEANVTAFYLIYGLVILGGFINRFTKKIETTKIKGFIFFSFLGALGAITIFCFISFYSNGWQAFFEKSDTDSSWGLFQTVGLKLKNWQAGIVFWVFIIYIFGLPFINDLLIKHSKEYKQNQVRLIWQRA